MKPRKRLCHLHATESVAAPPHNRPQVNQMESAPIKRPRILHGACSAPARRSRCGIWQSTHSCSTKPVGSACVGQREEADLTDADQAALVVRLAASEVGRAGKAGWIAAATKAADPFINVTFPAGPAGSVAMPSLTCNGPSAILIEAARHLGAKVDAGHIEIDTARIAEALAWFPVRHARALTRDLHRGGAHRARLAQPGLCHEASLRLAGSIAGHGRTAPVNAPDEAS